MSFFLLINLYEFSTAQSNLRPSEHETSPNYYSDVVTLSTHSLGGQRLSVVFHPSSAACELWNLWAYFSTYKIRIAMPIR